MREVQSDQERMGRQIRKAVFAKSLECPDKRVRIAHRLCGEAIRFEFMSPAEVIGGDTDQYRGGPDQNKEKCQANVERWRCHTECREDFREIYAERSGKEQQQKVKLTENEMLNDVVSLEVPYFVGEHCKKLWNRVVNNQCIVQSDSFV